MWENMSGWCAWKRNCRIVGCERMCFPTWTIWESIFLHLLQCWVLPFSLSIWNTAQNYCIALRGCSSLPSKGVSSHLDFFFCELSFCITCSLSYLDFKTNIFLGVLYSEHSFFLFCLFQTTLHIYQLFYFLNLNCVFHFFCCFEVLILLWLNIVIFTLWLCVCVCPVLGTLSFPEVKIHSSTFLPNISEGLFVTFSLKSTYTLFFMWGRRWGSNFFFYIDQTNCHNTTYLFLSSWTFFVCVFPSQVLYSYFESFYIFLPQCLCFLRLINFRKGQDKHEWGKEEREREREKENLE